MTDSLKSLLARASQAEDLLACWAQLSFGGTPTGHGCALTDQKRARDCAGRLFDVCVANLNSLFDPLGTNCLKSLSNPSSPDARKLLEGFILPTWLRVRPFVLGVRGNSSHHAPYHWDGWNHSRRSLQAVRPAEVVILTRAVRVATSLELTGNWDDSGLPLSSWLPSIEGSALPAAHEKAVGIFEGRLEGWRRRQRISVSALYSRLMHWTLRLPGRLIWLHMRRYGARQLRKHLNRSPRVELPESYELARDQFLQTNALFLAYQAFLIWRLPLGAIGHRLETHTLLLTWYSHLCTLFEERRASLGAIYPLMRERLPYVSTWFYENAIQPEWDLVGANMLRLRNAVGFHRASSTVDAEQIHLEMLKAIPPESSTYLMGVLYAFFWSIEDWQGRSLPTDPVPRHPVDAISPFHPASPYRSYHRRRGRFPEGIPITFLEKVLK
jgi:hypothetical protein